VEVSAVDRVKATGALGDEIVRLVRLLKTAAPNVSGADRSALLLLVPLMHDGPLRLRDLADAKGADPSTVSRQAAQLVRAGLVSRDRDPADGRAYRLRLTEAGRRLCVQIGESRRRVIADALRGWTDEDVCALTSRLREFNRCIEAATRPAGGGARTGQEGS
jgi:DNA-binding MarR family transcriptional regulator